MYESQQASAALLGTAVEPRAPIQHRVETINSLAQTLLTEIAVLTGKPAEESFGTVSFQEAVRRFEQKLIRHALNLARGNQRKAAMLLGLPATTLNSKIKRYRIEP